MSIMLAHLWGGLMRDESSMGVKGLVHGNDGFEKAVLKKQWQHIVGTGRENETIVGKQ